MSNVYSNDQIAEMFGVESSTVRGWKSKNPNQFVENIHWLTQDGSIYWTEVGLEALQAFRGKTPSSTPRGKFSTEGGTESVDFGTQILERYRPMVSWVARIIAPKLVGELDREVAQEFKQAAATPMTSEECVAVLVELGLPPINLAALADGSIAGLLQQQQEN